MTRLRLAIRAMCPRLLVHMDVLEALGPDLTPAEWSERLGVELTDLHRAQRLGVAMRAGT